MNLQIITTQADFRAMVQEAFRENPVWPMPPEVVEIHRLMALPALSPKQVAYLYQIPTQTLAIWRSEGRGPRFCKDVGKIVYLQEDLRAYFEKKRKITYA